MNLFAIHVCTSIVPKVTLEDKLGSRISYCARGLSAWRRLVVDGCIELSHCTLVVEEVVLVVTEVRHFSALALSTHPVEISVGIS